MIQFDEHIFQMGWFNHQLICFSGTVLGAGVLAAIVNAIMKCGSLRGVDDTNHDTDLSLKPMLDGICLPLCLGRFF